MNKEELNNLKQKYEELGAEIAKLESEAEPQYPIYKEFIHSSLIVKFTGLEGGIVIRGSNTHEVSRVSTVWIPHTDTDTWKDPTVVIDTDKDLYDGQPVWGWINDWTHCREARFYDAKNKCAYTVQGTRSGIIYPHYEPIIDIPKWMLEAQKTLEK